MSLYDEAAEKMLWFQLYDRHLVDDATLQEKFGMIPDVVAMRIKQEERQRDAGRKPPKATPFHDPQTDHELKKIALQQGTVSPTETGIEKDPKAAGDKSLIDHQNEQAAKDRALQKQQQEAQIEMDKKRLEQEKRQGDELHNQKLQHNDEKHQLEMKHRDQEHKTMLPIKRQALKKKTQIQLQNQKKGVPGQGRPKNKRDSQQRKSPRQSPRVKASLDMFSVQQWARDALEAIVKDTVRLLPERYGVKSARSLTATQAEELEMDRFGALCTTEPFATEPFAAEPFGAGHVDREMGDAVEIYKGLIASYVEKSGVEPTIDKRRDMMASAYAIWRSDGDDGV